jgi:hypothetical protein
MEERTTKAARIWVDAEGIIHFEAIGVASTAESVTESMAVLGELTGGNPRPILFDSRGWPSGDPASWVRFINSIESVCSAAAVIFDEESKPRMGAFPALLDSLMIPFRLFSDEDEAREFLRGH